MDQIFVKIRKSPLLGHICKIRQNFAKLGSVTFERLLTPNFMQKIRKNYQFLQKMKDQRILQSDWSRAFWAIIQEPDFSWTCGFRRMIKDHQFFHFKQKKYTSMDQIFVKIRKSRFLGHFQAFFLKISQTRFFPKNRAPSLFSIYGPLTSCKRKN